MSLEYRKGGELARLWKYFFLRNPCSTVEMLRKWLSVGDTCKEIGVARHGSDNACKLQMHNAEQLRVNRNFATTQRFS
jgi:hypothetical protein